MTEITLLPASQTSFPNLAIKSKWNIESTTDELIMKEKFPKNYLRIIFQQY